MGINLPERARLTLEYLVRDFNATLSDLKEAGAYIAGRRVPLYILAGAFMLGTILGCPWQKKHHDHDTTSGSSAPVTLSQAGQDALDLRFSQAEVFATAAGTMAQYVSLKAESDYTLESIANAGVNDADANDFIKILYDAEVAANYDILCGGTPVTLGQYSALFKFNSKTWTDGAVAAQTDDPAPDPFNIKFVNYETDNRMAGSGWGIAFDFINSKVKFYLKNAAGDEISFPVYQLTAEQMAAMKNLAKKYFTRVYLANEKDGNKTYSQTTGEPVKDGKAGQEIFNE